ncbi:hypothetical protein NKG05_27660 [Oerskovia sp. M15]
MIHKSIQEALGRTRPRPGRRTPRAASASTSAPRARSPRGPVRGRGRVNTQLAENLEVTDKVMPIAEAKALGAMALFGEKYGDQVRVVSIGGDWSRELCAARTSSSRGSSAWSPCSASPRSDRACAASTRSSATGPTASRPRSTPWWVSSRAC